jgi:hypothetical protein
MLLIEDVRADIPRVSLSVRPRPHHRLLDWLAGMKFKVAAGVKFIENVRLCQKHRRIGSPPQYRGSATTIASF